MENTTLQNNSDINISENDSKINEKIVQLNFAGDYKKLAVEKLETERKAMNPSKTSAVGIMYNEVANVLRNFCSQDDKFAEIVYKTKRTFNDCMNEVAKNAGHGISDIDAYRRAIQFYFPNSQIEFLMKMTLTGEEPDEKYINKETPKPKSKPAAKPTNKSAEERPQKPTAKEKEKKKAPEIIQLTMF